MAISNKTRGLASTIVIIVLILPEIAAQAVSPATNVSKPVTQQDNTIRVDPLNNFKKYKGGFDITNKHYWSSVVFTGVYGYAIGVLWLLSGLLYGVFYITINCCCQSDGERRTKSYLLRIPLAILLMILAMAASGLVLAGSAKFHSQARTSVNVIIKTANDASETIYNATRAIKEIQGDLMDSGVGAEASGKLDSITEKFDAAADNIAKEASKNRHIINKAFKVLFVITIVIISLNLIGVTTLSVCGILRFRRTLYLLVILCWLVTVICWLIFGVYFFLENFSNDACTALYSFQENPYNNSLSSIIPCDDLASAKPVLTEIGTGIYILVNVVNSNITNLQGKLIPNLAPVCNPFSAPPEYLYQPENCPTNTVQIGDIPKVLKPYTCFDDTEEKCGNEDFLTSSEYEVVEAYTSSIQTLLNVYPGMENLLGCQLVKDALSQVLFKHCKPLKKFARMTWIGMVILAVIMVFLVVLWTIKAPHEHSYNLSDGSRNA